MDATPISKEVVPPETQTQTSKKRKAEGLSLMDRKKFKASLEPVHPSVSFKNIGGNEKVLLEVTQMLIHMRHPEVRLFYIVGMFQF